MILSNKDIIKAIDEKNVAITPVPEMSQYSTSALDLRAGDKFWRYKKQGQGIQTIVDFDLITATAETFHNLSGFLEPITLDEDRTLTYNKTDLFFS